MSKKKNVFSFTPMIRVDYSFPNVDEKQRSKIYDVIFDPDLSVKKFRGGGGDGSNNSGVMYIPVDEVDKLRQRLSELGLSEKTQL